MTDWKDVASRAGWTIVQAFLAVEVAAGTTWVSVSTLKAAGIAAGAAALSSLKTVALQHYRGSTA